MPWMSDPVLFDRQGQLGIIRLNRPQRLNAIDGASLDLLESSIDQAESDVSVRAVLLFGEGRAFCAGADLDYVTAHLGSPAAYSSFLSRWHEVFNRVADCSKPVVAGVHGFALAGGLELMEACDLAAVAEDAQIGDQHAALGLFPGGGSTQRLPRLIGQRRAKWLLMSGSRISAADALEFGLANWVVPEAEVREKARWAADQLAALSMAATTQIKRSVASGLDVSLARGLEIERELAVEHMLGPAAALGLEAFSSRTTPQFADHDL